MQKNLIEIKNATTKVFVYFPILPIDRRFEDSLHRHLLSNSGVLDDPTQDVVVLNEIFPNRGDINAIRYQFGSIDSADSDIDDISERIEKEFLNWLWKMGGYESVKPLNIQSLDGVLN